jgi:hypothetical protein
MKLLLAGAIALLAASAFAQSPNGMELASPTRFQDLRDGAMVPVPSCSAGFRAVASISYPARASLTRPLAGTTLYALSRRGAAWRVSIREGASAALTTEAIDATADVETACAS